MVVQWSVFDFFLSSIFKTSLFITYHSVVDKLVFSFAVIVKNKLELTLNQYASFSHILHSSLSETFSYTTVFKKILDDSCEQLICKFWNCDVIFFIKCLVIFTSLMVLILEWTLIAQFSLACTNLWLHDSSFYLTPNDKASLILSTSLIRNNIKSLKTYLLLESNILCVLY